MIIPYQASSWWERNARDPKIRKLYAEGKSIFYISQEVGLSEWHIRNILKHYEEFEMTETLKWIMTADHKPSFEECANKLVVYHRGNWDVTDRVFATNIDKDDYRRMFYNDNLENADRYILIDIPSFIPDPEPVPCRVCGNIPEVGMLLDDATVYCKNNDHHIYFYAPTRDEAVSLWNKHNS